jgi:dephospho-CoA kinase
VLRVGLTGGVASGKSTVTAFFRELGAGIVDTDLIAREVVAPGDPGLVAVRKAFGESIITSTGELDRAALRKIVFQDPIARHRLEEILHPLIRARTLSALGRIDDDYALVVVPLLAETDFAALVDRVAVVDCPRSQQLARLIERDGMSPAEAEAMLNAQVDRTTRLALAHDVIDNSGSHEAAREQVKRLDKKYHELGQVCRHRRARAE